MRLVCPNCGAQYEVDDRVIPEGGRDVQCSACGHGWYQMPPLRKPDEGQDDALPPEAEHDVGTDDAPEQPGEGDGDTGGDSGVQSEAAVADAPSHEPGEDVPTPEPRKIDTGVRSILQEEAQRELEARAAEPKAAPENVETQPDLGLDARGASPEEERRRIARERMARMRGLDEEDADADQTSAEFDLNEAPPERRAQGKELFPDIEEINSTLDSHAPAAEPGADGPQAPRKKTASGFGRGFSLMLLIAALMVTVYVLAPKLATTIPALKPALTAYVEAVDASRVWLDTTLRGVVDKIEDAAGGTNGG